MIIKVHSTNLLKINKTEKQTQIPSLCFIYFHYYCMIRFTSPPARLSPPSFPPSSPPTAIFHLFPIHYQKPPLLLAAGGSSSISESTTHSRTPPTFPPFHV